MTYTKVPNTCSQCGAVLTRQNNSLVCEYCGQEYSAPPQNFKEENADDSTNFTVSIDSPDQIKITVSIDTKDGHEFHKPAEPTDAIDFTKHIPQASNTQKNNSQTGHPYQAYLILLAILGCGIYYFLFMSKEFQNTQQQPIIQNTATKSRNVNSQQDGKYLISTLQSYVNLKDASGFFTKYYHSIVYPSDFIEQSQVAAALVLEDAHADIQIFSLYLQNNTESDLNTGKDTQQMQITSLKGSDDLDRQFQCEFEDEPNIKNMRSGRTRKVGVIYCYDTMTPQPTAMQIDIATTDRGTYQFQIPTGSNLDDIQVKHHLSLTPGERPALHLHLYSENPQIVLVQKSDITIRDDLGNSYSMDNCLPFDSQGPNGNSFITLTKNESYYNKYQKIGLASCYYDEPFSSNVDRLTVTIHIREKTFISTATIDTDYGEFEFTNRVISGE